MKKYFTIILLLLLQLTCKAMETNTIAPQEKKPIECMECIKIPWLFGEEVIMKYIKHSENKDELLLGNIGFFNWSKKPTYSWSMIREKKEDGIYFSGNLYDHIEKECNSFLYRTFAKCRMQPDKLNLFFENEIKKCKDCANGKK